MHKCHITAVLMAGCSHQLCTASCVANENLTGRTYSDNLQTVLKHGVVVDSIRIDIEPMQNVANGYTQEYMQSQSNAHKNTTRNASVEDITELSIMSTNLAFRITTVMGWMPLSKVIS